MIFAKAKAPGLIKTSLILTHPILMTIAFTYIIIMNGCPLCSHYTTILMLLHVIASLPLVSPKHSNDGEEESGALNGSEYFSYEPHYIHDEMIDASPGLHPNDIHDLEDDLEALQHCPVVPIAGHEVDSNPL
jgi:hypothetical protein